MRIVISAVFALAAAHAAAGAPALHVDASLIADAAAPARDAPLWIGLRMRHVPGWHTYWKNPGDAGLPTRIQWTLPDGWSASGINWPAPARLPVGPLASYGYEGDAVLPVKLVPAAGWDAKTPVRVAAHVSWLACKEQCIPESADLALSLPANGSAAEHSLFDAWRAHVPQAFRFKVASAQRNGGRLLLTLEPAAASEFFPDREELVEPGDPPQLAVAGNRVTWSARLGVQGKALTVPASISGVWVPKVGRPVFVEAKLK